MDRITTTTGKRVGYIAYDLSDGETSSTIVLRVVPAIGFRLQSFPSDADFQMQARRTTSGDAFVDIAATPIDLSGYPEGVPLDFDFRVVIIGSLTDVRRLAIFLSVTSLSAVAW